MRKIMMMASVALLAFMGACGGAKEKGEAENAEQSTVEVQPLVSGEYRVDSYTYDEPGEARNRFDGRMLVAISPEASGVYIYENGNRTKFNASVSLSQLFEKTDSMYDAAAYVGLDGKERPVVLIVGGENDTIAFMKGNRMVKVAFEAKPMSEMPAADVWNRIQEKLEK